MSDKFESHVPATGSSDPEETEIRPEEEPTTTGTLFIMMLFLMTMAAFWILLYLRLLER